MAKKCGWVTYYRPCREKKPRVYKPCDVARIAGYCRAAGYNSQDIISVVGDRLGYPTLIDGKNLSREELQQQALLILKTAGTIEDMTKDIPIVSWLAFILHFTIKFAGAISFIVGYVAAAIIANRALIRYTYCDK